MRVPTMAVPRSTRAPRAWAEWGLALWSKILSTHGVGEAHAKHSRRSEIIGHFHVTSDLGGSCELRARRLMR